MYNTVVVRGVFANRAWGQEIDDWTFCDDAARGDASSSFLGATSSSVEYSSSKWVPRRQYSPGHSNVHTFVFAAIFSTFVSIVKR